MSKRGGSSISQNILSSVSGNSQTTARTSQTSSSSKSSVSSDSAASTQQTPNINQSASTSQNLRGSSSQLNATNEVPPSSSINFNSQSDSLAYVATPVNSSLSNYRTKFFKFGLYLIKYLHFLSC